MKPKTNYLQLYTSHLQKEIEILQRWLKVPTLPNYLAAEMIGEVHKLEKELGIK